MSSVDSGITIPRLSDSDDIVSYYQSNHPFILEHFAGDVLANFLDIIRVEAILKRQLPVINCCSSTYYTSTPVFMSLEEYLSHISPESSLYLKDWHIDKIESFQYEYPHCLKDDWWNWHWKNYLHHSDDYIFLYCGGRRTFTPIHHDVCSSYSWSWNINGRKKWTLWSPKVIISNALNENDIQSLLQSQYSSDSVEVIQDVDEIIFIPSGWYHRVENLPPLNETSSNSILNCTISLNRNWFNGFNIYEIWRFLVKELNSIRKEIWPLFDPRSCEDKALLMTSQEWHRHCETLLRANSALNVQGFLELISARVAVMAALDSLDYSSQPWCVRFSPHFQTTMLTTDDNSLYLTWRRESVNSCRDDSVFLSTVWSLLPLDSSSVIIKQRTRIVETIYPITIWTYILQEIVIILEEILSSDEICLHVSQFFDEESKDSIECLLRKMIDDIQYIQ